MTAKKSSSSQSAGAAGPKKRVPAKAVKKPAKKATQGRSADQKYTDPDLRERIKEAIMAGDKGANPGQWSARKAQMVAHQYEAEGGGYKGGQDETQHSLETWGEEHWTTKDGSPAKQDDGMHRYLPEAAWDQLTPAQQASTDAKKLKGSAAGKQFVSNTAPAKSARKQAVKRKP
ncbi:MAG: hypothetical protein ACRYGF_02770 [Janthinobacterium lividum]